MRESNFIKTYLLGQNEEFKEAILDKAFTLNFIERVERITGKSERALQCSV